MPIDTVNLDATVTDDGLPDPPVSDTVTWAKVSGPGTVVFDDANSVDTNAVFSAEGIYVLSLSADDGELNTSDEVSVTVNGEITTLTSGVPVTGEVEEGSWKNT